MVPERLGRYEVIASLATGGMAEILLGQLRGESGFERPVVIKRILPHLARIESFVNMFLDEARIVASIRHPNVVFVQELCRDRGELFLVMEYLEGESASSVCRRLLTRGEELDHRLAAFIVAEACCGLHAAHELTDREGAKQNLVHRDVSPQNVFVTYGGHVKVIDFGIATAADRVARTEAGELKGKFDYMSPEQCEGKPLDRRSDIFALGIVLYELTTMHRLFRRDTPVASMHAILAGEIVPPARLVEGYPACLESICMKALSRDRGDRHVDAQEMRRDLVGAIRELDRTMSPRPHESFEELARLMAFSFPERIAEKQELLRRASVGSEVTHVPSQDPEDLFEIPLATVAEPRPVRLADGVMHGGSRKWFAVMGGLAALVGAVFVYSRHANAPPLPSRAPDAPASAAEASSASNPPQPATSAAFANSAQPPRHTETPRPAPNRRAPRSRPTAPTPNASPPDPGYAPWNEPPGRATPP